MVRLTPERAGGEDRAAELRGYLQALDSELATPMSVEHALSHGSDDDAVFIPDRATEASPLAAPTRVRAAICRRPGGPQFAAKIANEKVRDCGPE
jgi:hypothetical protein